MMEIPMMTKYDQAVWRYVGMALWNNQFRFTEVKLKYITRVVFLAWQTHSTCGLVGFPAKKPTRVMFPLKKHSCGFLILFKLMFSSHLRFWCSGATCNNRQKKTPSIAQQSYSLLRDGMWGISLITMRGWQHCIVLIRFGSFVVPL
jgi:hypothetical protein